MVPLARPLIACASCVLALLSAAACSRDTELRDENDGGSGLGTMMLPEAGTLTEIPDAGFDDPSFGECRERPRGDCVGVNDFPCDFPRWIAAVASECMTMTECRADDWVRFGMNAEGCVESISMKEEDRAFVDCMVERLGPYSCPCGAGTAEHFLGIDNDGCFIGCTDELPCEDGYTCVSGFCIEK